jgi:hypothetical protein
MNNENSQKIFCSQCGAQNDTTGRFCSSCGAVLVKADGGTSATAATPATTPPTVPVNPTVPVTSPVQPTSPAPATPAAASGILADKSKSIFLIALAMLAVTVIVFIIVFAVTANGGKDSITANAGISETDDADETPGNGGLSKADNAPSGDDEPFTGKIQYNGDNGKKYAYTELVNDQPAGFTIFYNPSNYIFLGYSTEGKWLSAGAERGIMIEFDGGDYLRTYIGDFRDGKFDGKGYMYWDYTATDGALNHYSKNSTNGECYGYYADDAYVEVREQNMGENISTEEKPLESSGKSKSVYLKDKFGYTETDTYSGFFDGDTDEYSKYGYFYNQDDGHTYRGEIKDGKYDGLGIYTYSDYDVYIGQFKNGVMDGYGLYILNDGNTSASPVYHYVKCYKGKIVGTVQFDPMEGDMNFDEEIFF